MENPASWGKTERVISEAIQEHAKDMAEHRMGLSLERTISDALRQAGLLKEGK